MVRCLVRRLIASVMLFVVAVGGGGMPVLDAVALHGPTRLVESLRTHYEASSACHADGCSIRSDVQPRVMGDRVPRAPAVVSLKSAEPVPFGESDSGSIVTLPYLSRAPPVAS